MKVLLLILISLTFLRAEIYILSGGKDNVVHIVASKILQKAYTRAGLEMEPIFLPLSKSLEFSNSGKTDGEIARIKAVTKKFPHLVIIPVPLISVEAIVFSKDRSLSIHSWSDLSAYKTAIVKGTKFIEKGTQGIEVTALKSFKEAFIKLDKNEFEVLVIPKLAGMKIIYEEEYRDIKPISPPLQKLQLYHFVNKKNQHLIKVLTPVLQKMKDSGETAYMRDAYLMRLTK